MTEYNDVVKALSEKLKKDKEGNSCREGVPDLYYVLAIRLEQTILEQADALGYPLNADQVATLADKVSADFLDGVIALGDK